MSQTELLTICADSIRAAERAARVLNQGFIPMSAPLLFTPCEVMLIDTSSLRPVKESGSLTMTNDN